MLFLVGCCSFYGVLLVWWLLKGCLSTDDRHGSSKCKHLPAVEKARCLMQELVSEPEVAGTKLLEGRFRHSKLPRNSLRIERKLFCASLLIPGRLFRVTEMLADRRFSVDLTTAELHWFIGALREAFSAKSVLFSKQRSLGRRFLELSIVSNRSGVVLKLSCSLGGKRRRFLFIPAGKNYEGWDSLAKILVSVLDGGKRWVKKSFPPCNLPPRADYSLHRVLPESPSAISDVAVKPIGNPRVAHSPEELSLVKSGWKEGFLPDLLKVGLNLSLGAPSSSGEANRSFGWRAFQSELGLGTLVVEFPHGDGSLGNKKRVNLQVRGGLVSYGGGVDGSVGELVVSEAEEVEVAALGKGEAVGASFESAEVVVDGLGNLIPASLLTTPPDALTRCSFVPLDDASSLSCGPSLHVSADPHATLSIGELMGFGWAEAALSSHLGGPADGSDFSTYQTAAVGLDAILGSAHGSHPDMRFMASHADITICDNEETLSFDSPASDGRVRFAEEMCAADGCCSPEDFCTICGSPEPCDGIGGNFRW